MQDPSEIRFAILASGQGSNADALMAGFASGFLPATLALVLTNVDGAAVAAKAQRRGFPTMTVPHKGLTRVEHETKVLEVLTTAQVDHVLLAGYMRVLSPHFLDCFAGAVINIHPALLPDFRGMHAAQAQHQSHAKVTGATVHFVDAGVDTGPILLMGSIEARADEDETSFVYRLQTEVEHVIYPRAVRLFLDRLRRGATEGVGRRSRALEAT
jgi:phosphoribosylglycinamide formyltransferase 1